MTSATLSPPVFIGIIEDDAVLRDYLKRTVGDIANFNVSFATETLAEAHEQLKIKTPDLCLVDIQLPDGNGLDFIAQLKKNTETKALVLTVLGDRNSVINALSSGADGYLLKDTRPDDIAVSIRQTLDGQTPISPQAATHLLHSFHKATLETKIEDRANDVGLTPKEEEILTLFSKGLSYKETAEALSITHNTVSHHVKAIYSKLCVNSRSEAIYEAMQIGVLDKNIL